MFESEHVIVVQSKTRGRLMHDLKVLTAMHSGMAKEYREMQIEAPAFRPLNILERFANEHAMQVAALLRLIERNGGSGARLEMKGAISAKLRAALSSGLNENCPHAAVRLCEQNLAAEYEKRVGALADATFAGPALRLNYERITRRLRVIDNLQQCERSDLVFADWHSPLQMNYHRAMLCESTH